MSDDSKKRIDDLVKGYQDIIEHLNQVKEKSTEEQHSAINSALSASICCNACQAISSICVPDATPSKCQGGCTITSYAF
jgi:phosphopantothenate synthetase